MIYLDHAAATPVSPRALAAMQPYFSELFFNPSSPYLAAKRVREAYETAKSDIAHAIGAKSPDLVMTSGATESINLAFTCVSHKCLVSVIEHSSVLECAKQHDFDTIRVDKFGVVDLDDLRRKLTPDVELISVALANNELGTIQPLADIAAIVREERFRRMEQGNSTPLYLHSDASQALSLVDINVSRMGVDLLTLNSAKVGGPKGVGALYVAHGVKLHPVNFGGGQEQGLRSGTENVPGVMGFAAAAMHAKEHLGGNRKKYTQLVKILRDELAKSIIPPVFLGNPKHQLANFCPVSFPGLDAERLIYKLEAHEVYLSTGAACAANKGSKSHVLTSIGLSEPEIAGSLRISLGVLNDENNIRLAAQLIRQCVQEEYDRIHR